MLDQNQGNTEPQSPITVVIHSQPPPSSPPRAALEIPVENDSDVPITLGDDSQTAPQLPPDQYIEQQYEQNNFAQMLIASAQVFDEPYQRLEYQQRKSIRKTLDKFIQRYDPQQVRWQEKGPHIPIFWVVAVWLQQKKMKPILEAEKLINDMITRASTEPVSYQDELNWALGYLLFYKGEPDRADAIWVKFPRDSDNYREKWEFFDAVIAKVGSPDSKLLLQSPGSRRGSEVKPGIVFPFSSSCYGAFFSFPSNRQLETTSETKSFDDLDEELKGIEICFSKHIKPVAHIDKFEQAMTMAEKATRLNRTDVALTIYDMILNKNQYHIEAVLAFSQIAEKEAAIDKVNAFIAQNEAHPRLAKVLFRLVELYRDKLFEESSSFYSGLMEKTIKKCLAHDASFAATIQTLRDSIDSTPRQTVGKCSLTPLME